MDTIERLMTNLFYWIDDRNLYISGMIITLSLVIGLIGFLPIFGKQGEEDSKVIMTIAFRKVIVISLVILVGAQIYRSTFITDELEIPSLFYVATALVAWLLGKVFGIYYKRYIAPQWSNMFAKYKVGQTTDELSDIRTEIGRIQQADFDPRKHYKDGHILRGIDQDEQFVYDTRAVWKDNHEAVIGPSQTGKGVNIGVQVDQAIRAGDCVIFIDPKPDKFCRAIMQKACADTKREFIEVDLNGVCKTQRYNLTASGTPEEVRNRLIGITELEGKGSDADHYKRQERRLLDGIIREVGTRSIEKILLKVRAINAANQRSDPLGTTDATLTEITNLIGICDEGGLNLRKALMENKVIYLRSSTTDDRIRKITKSFIDDLIQSIIATDKESGGTRTHHVFVVIDEVRFLVTELLIHALATIKGFNSHMLIAYQSRLDIRNTNDQTLDKDSTETSINTNATTKLCYMAADNDTAEWVAKESGKVNKRIADREKLETNTAGGETITGERHLTNAEEQLITSNVVQALPPRCAVLLQPARLASILKTCWVPIDLDTYSVTRYRPGELKPKTILDIVENSSFAVEDETKPTNYKPETGKKKATKKGPQEQVDISQVLRDMKEKKE